MFTTYKSLSFRAKNGSLPARNYICNLFRAPQPPLSFRTETPPWSCLSPFPVNHVLARMCLFKHINNQNTPLVLPLHSSNSPWPCWAAQQTEAVPCTAGKCPGGCSGKHSPLQTGAPVLHPGCFHSARGCSCPWH